MHSQLISPNLHVILIHYPLAMLIAGTLIEFFSFLWRRSSFRTAGRWMILIGALSAVPATFSGIYALRDVARIDSQIRWLDLKSTSPVLSRPEVWEMLRHHMIYQSIATAAAVLVVVIWIGASDGVRRTLHLSLLTLLLATVAIMVTGAWLGGESIYKNSVGVETTPPMPAIPSTEPVSWTNSPTRVEQLFPPLELHTIMAGVTTAIALVAIGLSCRKITSVYDAPEELPMVTGDPQMISRGPRTPPSSVLMGRTFNPDLELEITPFVPAARFWLLAFVLALSTALGGLFVLARDADVFTQMDNQPKQIPKLLWEQIKPEPGEKVNRLLAHAVSGTAIVVLPIILALLARFAPRERIILALMTICLIAAVSAQVWLGILLLFDTTEGPLNHFNPATTVDLHP